MLNNQRIAVLKGGPGSERPVSLASAAGVEKALRSLGATVFAIDVMGTEFELPENLDIAFNMIHGTFGEDGRIQKILEERGVVYTGEGVAGSRLAFDKIETKKRFVEKGVPTAAFEILKAGERPLMSLPYVVKAPSEGSSVGVYIVKKQEEIEPAFQDVARYTNTVLVEKFTAGSELTIGILGDLVLPVIMICPKEGFYDFKNKYPFLNPKAAGADHFCPAPLDEAQTRLVQETALLAHRALGLEVYSRVDIILTDAGEPLVLEINTIPGMTEASLLPEAAGVAGIGYKVLCERIIEFSRSRRCLA